MHFCFAQTQVNYGGNGPIIGIGNIGHTGTTLVIIRYFIKYEGQLQAANTSSMLISFTIGIRHLANYRLPCCTIFISKLLGSGQLSRGDLQTTCKLHVRLLPIYMYLYAYYHHKPFWTWITFVLHFRQNYIIYLLLVAITSLVTITLSSRVITSIRSGTLTTWLGHIDLCDHLFGSIHV